jgi:hypothetical protein
MVTEIYVSIPCAAGLKTGPMPLSTEERTYGFQTERTLNNLIIGRTQPAVSRPEGTRLKSYRCSDNLLGYHTPNRFPKPVRCTPNLFLTVYSYSTSGLRTS